MSEITTSFTSKYYFGDGKPMQCKKSSDGKTFYWYDSNGSNERNLCNQSGTVYAFMATG